MKPNKLLLAAWCGVALLSGCGGGGGGGGSSSLPTPNPVPSISSLSPAATLAGAASTLTVNGTNFVFNSTVQVNGSNRTTAYVSATQLTASLTAADVASSGTVTITVVNPTPGGGTSSALELTVADVLANASSLGPAMFAQQLGANVNIGYLDDTNSAFIPIYQSAGVSLFRYPGGDLADFFHWQTDSYGPCSPWSAPPASTNFDNWMQSTPIPLGAAVNITVNYETNPTCTGLADPNEAAAWVNHANNTQHYGVKYWSVGNEEYYWSGTTATTYASSVATGFYPLMKAQDSTIQVGVDVAFGNLTYDVSADTWDPVVLANAKYDFVETHYYPEGLNQNNDAKVLSTWSDQIPTNFSTIETLLATAGKPNTPIFLGEFDRDYGNKGYPGHQSVSIVNGLFTAIVIGEVAKAGVSMGATWLGLDFCWPDSSPPSTAYGWQNWGSWGLIAASGSGFSESCADKGAPGGTVFPKGRAFQIMSQYVVPGEHVIGVQSGDSSVRAYAATNATGYALVLVNTDSANSHSPLILVANAQSASYTATSQTYGKEQYDLSQTGVWAGPVSADLGTVSIGNFSVALPPWSITFIKLVPTG